MIKDDSNLINRSLNKCIPYIIPYIIIINFHVAIEMDKS